MRESRIAIMQPYLFPYIGYFQLIHASDLFVFYDDVQYIKRGWINRNRILCKDQELFFTIPVSRYSYKKSIKDVSPIINEKWIDTFYKQLVYNYKKSVCFYDVIDYVMSIFNKKYSNISDIAIDSVVAVCSYLGIDFLYSKSSICLPQSVDIGRDDRLIEIIKKMNYKNYINTYGGKELYSKEYFLKNGIVLQFIKSNTPVYKQYENIFVENLSIIDVLMFNKKDDVLNFLSLYDIE